MLTRLFKFYIYSNIFIACCTILMVLQTDLFVLHIDPNPYFLGFAFFSTLTSYSFHWFLTGQSFAHSDRIAWIHENRAYHFILFWVGLAGTSVFFFYLLHYWHWLLLGAVVTFLYSAPKIPNKYFRLLRRVAYGKTLFLAGVWTYVTTILPFLISEKPVEADIALFVVSRFFLIYAICIVFDYRDRTDDISAGIRSMITYFSEKGVDILFALSILLFVVFTVALYWYDFSTLEIVLLLIPGLVMAGLYKYSKRNFSDIFYYFVLDGLMMLSALLMLIFSI